MNRRRRACSEPLVKTRDCCLGVVAQIPCGSGQRHDPDVSGEYKVTYEQKRVRWEAEGFVGSGSPWFLPTPRFHREFRKSLILNWSGRVDSNHRPPGPEPWESPFCRLLQVFANHPYSPVSFILSMTSAVSVLLRFVADCRLSMHEKGKKRAK